MSQTTELAKVSESSLIPFEQIDENLEDRHKGYYTIQYIKKFWNKIYKKFIYPTMFEIEGSPKEVIEKIDEIKSFIMQAINDIYNTNIIGILDKLQKLQDLFVDESFPLRTDTKTLKPYVKLIQEINAAFDEMALVAANPNWIVRNSKRIIGKAKPQLSPSNKERILNLIEKSLLGATEVLAEKLNIEEKFRNAFSILSLPFTSSKEDVEKRRRELGKRYHPDIQNGMEDVYNEKMSEINGAADLLIKEFFKKYGA